MATRDAVAVHPALAVFSMTDVLIPGPRLPVRCVCCRRWIRRGPVIKGMGIGCATRAGLVPVAAPRIRAPVTAPPCDDEPNLLDLLDTDEGEHGEPSERICGPDHPIP